MNEQEKLRVLLPHWIEHNEEHVRELRRWSANAGAAAADIEAAVDAMVRGNEKLAAALQKLGGALHKPHGKHG